MEFNSQICTTEEQSLRLLALGLKKETADMTLQTSLDVCYTMSFQEAVEYFENRHLPLHPTILPAWSLHRLIVLSGMGIIESSTDNIYDKVIQYIKFLIKCGVFNKEYLEE
jgi:hypothetical protein